MVLADAVALDQAALERLASAAEHHDADTRAHLRRVGRTAGLIARVLGLPAEEAQLIDRAAPLHDIGKIAIPDAILLKPGRLAQAERLRMEQHTVIGARLLGAGRSPVLQLAADIALSHHERWDGSGYPYGLAGDAIPLAGRITAVADVFDALTHARPYKDPWPVARAARTVMAGRGAAFGPDVVAAFAELRHTALVARGTTPALAGGVARPPRG